MGASYLFNKLDNIKIHTNGELEEYIYEGNTITLFNYRKHYWLENYFRTNAKYGTSYDDFILIKEDIINFIKEINLALETNCSNFDKEDFFRTSHVEEELRSVLNDMNNLLNEDFDNNTIYFSEI